MKFSKVSDIAHTSFGETSFITGLRAYAAIMVIMIHSGGAGLRDIGNVGNQIADLGATGVYIFFVISGFCIAHTLSNKQSLKSFWRRRFWRIAPLYFFTCVSGLIFILLGWPISTWRETLGVDNILYEALLHFSFLSSLDYRVTNSFIGVEWSIPIEMFWYCIIPFFLPLLKNWKTVVLLFLIICGIFSLKLIYNQILEPGDAALAIKWSPLRYAPAFFLGILSFRLRPIISEKIPSHILDKALGLGLILSMIELIFVQVGNQYLNIILLSFALLLVGGHGKISNLLFENKVAIFLGNISYSLYLTHMFVLAFIPENLSNYNFIKFLFVASITAAISTLTYIFIEQKGVKIGKNLTKNKEDLERHAAA